MNLNGVKEDATMMSPDSSQLNRKLNGKLNGHVSETDTRSKGSSQTLLSVFLKAHREIEDYKRSIPIKIDGHTLSIAGLVGVARHRATFVLDDSPTIKERINKTRQIVENNVLKGSSVYGLSTGFGGSADTRTDQPILLGEALVQHQTVGVMPTNNEPQDVLPLLDPATATTMPEAWVRGAILVRMNSMVRGHSAVRWEIAEKLHEILNADLVPCIPIHGSVSASGDLAPLSYIAGTVTGNPRIRVYHGPHKFGLRQVTSSAEAFRQYGIEPVPLASKEHLSILNGTAFSTSVGALAIHEAVHLALLGQVCTAMGVEAMLAARGSFHPFLHAATRPHPGQVECAHNIWTLLEGSKLARYQEQDVSFKDDQYTLRQDRYSWRAVPQFLGPQIEDLLAAFTSVTQECNSTTDNPLIDSETGQIHYGANFQAMAITNAMEKTRLALHHIGKTMFAQSTELVNPTMNNGLPPSVAATDPSLDYHVKGLDITIAAYTAELGYLASPVSTHIQSAEMHNQSINSMALVAARATINSIQVLSMLLAAYLYILCQALDIRALQTEFMTGLPGIVRDSLKAHFGSCITPSGEDVLVESLVRAMWESLDKTTIMDNVDRMQAAANATAAPLTNFFASSSSLGGCDFNALSEFCKQTSTRAAALQDELRKDYLTGARGPTPASPYLSKTKAVYEFIRGTLGVKMHGYVNYMKFPNVLGVDEVTIGENTSIIYEAIRDGKMQSIVVSLFD